MLTIDARTDLRPLRRTFADQGIQCEKPPSRAHRLDAAPHLTARQIEVLKHVAEGMQNKEIMRELGITRKTLEMHVANAIAALGARNRVAAAVSAVRLGIL